jgi:hypothetical protein
MAEVRCLGVDLDLTGQRADGLDVVCECTQNQLLGLQTAQQLGGGALH